LDRFADVLSRPFACFHGIQPVSNSDSTSPQNRIPQSPNNKLGENASLSGRRLGRRLRLWRRLWLGYRFRFWRGFKSDLSVKSLISLLLRFAPRTFLIDKPMFRPVGLADLGLRATAIDHLIIAVAYFLVSIFYPHAGLIDDVGELFRVVG